MSAATDVTRSRPDEDVSTLSRPRPASPARPAIRLLAVRKSFGEVAAVAGVDLEVLEGEFFSLLGPSGSGKTTTLRLIAGFERADAGRILLGEQDVTDQPPFLRDVNTVFQDYALFPHLSVGDNVTYGLMIRKVPRAEREARSAEALRVVRLEGYAGRRPSQLSGGQRQRVALARALINRPRVLLLDEPLGALDLKLREEMQAELKRIQEAVGITFVYVTHDQGEALAMSDRLAVFSAGRIEQVGTPAEVYERPATAFVAGFVGISNLLAGPAAEAVLGRQGSYTIRPEKIALVGVETPLGTDDGTALGIIREVTYLGSETRYRVALDAGAELTVSAQNLTTSSTEALAARGRPVRLIWQRQHEYPVAASERTTREEEDET